MPAPMHCTTPPSPLRREGEMRSPLYTLTIAGYYALGAVSSFVAVLEALHVAGAP